MPKAEIALRQARHDDIETVASILTEAAQWLDSRGMAMWRPDEVTPDHIREDVADGIFYLAEADEAVGVLRFQLSDPIFWPDVQEGVSAFVHRFAVRRRVAGTGISADMLTWAALRTAGLGRQFLRLDCEGSRHRLRAVYERFGFRHHSDLQVGLFFVARYELDVRHFQPATADGR